MTKPLTEQMAELRDWRDRMAPSYGPQAERTQYFGMARERRDRWRDVDRLLATVEAQAEVIARYKEAVRSVLTSCRECRDERDFYTDPVPPADFIVWGKLSAPEALGPKCHDHAVKHLGQAMPGRASQYAVVDLRPLRRLLGEVVAPRGESDE